MSRIETDLPRGDFKGRPIAQTKKRETIQQLMVKAADKSRRFIIGKKRASAVYEEIVRLGGIAIAERRNRNKDFRRGYGCIWYVFSTVKGESWGKIPADNVPSDLLLRTREFLEGKGYLMVDEPQDGDIVTYRQRVVDDNGEHLRARHFGIWQAGMVVSKFGPGPVFRHEIDAVPSAYGEEVVFFRKVVLPEGK